jgi:sugar phosphate isomerase/epimerase
MTLTLWGPSVLPFTLEQRLEASLAGGFAATSVIPWELRKAQAAGVSMDSVRAMFEDAGVSICLVDPLASWLPGFDPPAGIAEDDPVVGAFGADEVFAMCEAVGADLVTALALFVPLVGADHGAEHFAEVCDRAAEHGVRIQLEFIPGTGVPDIALAWEIVRRAGRANGGLLADSWHFFRSVPDYELLSSIPGEKLFAVQIEDAPAVAADDLAWESLHGRLVPGDGELDLARFVAALPPGERPIGPEVFSDELWQLEPAAIGRLLGERTRALIDG